MLFFRLPESKNSVGWLFRLPETQKVGGKTDLRGNHILLDTRFYSLFGSRCIKRSITSVAANSLRTN